MSIDTQKLNLQRVFILALAIGMSVIFFTMIKGFLSALFIAAVITLFVQPLYDWLFPRLGERQAVTAAIVLLIALTALIIPTIMLIGLVVEQAVGIAQSATPWLQEQLNRPEGEALFTIPDWVPFHDRLPGLDFDLSSKVGEIAAQTGRFAVNSLSAATGGTMSFFLSLFVMIYALFYFLVAGKSLARGALTYMPMRTEDRELLAERAISTVRATVRGTFVIGAVQGGLTGIGMAVAGLPGAAFWGAVTGVLSIIPGLGPPLVWGSASVYLIATGNTVAGIGLAIWGMAVVSWADNILRPSLVGKDAKMSDLMVLLSTLGGLTMFGAVGIIIGPVLAALFTSAWFIYRQSFGELLDGDANPVPAETGKAPKETQD